MSSDLWSLTASELAAGYRAGGFTPLDALLAIEARLDVVNPHINAVIAEHRAAARGQAAASTERWRAGEAAVGDRRRSDDDQGQSASRRACRPPGGAGFMPPISRRPTRRPSRGCEPRARSFPARRMSRNSPCRAMRRTCCSARAAILMRRE